MKKRGETRTKWARTRAKRVNAETDQEARHAWKEAVSFMWGCIGLWSVSDEGRRPGPGGWRKPYWAPEILQLDRWDRWDEAVFRPDRRKHWKQHRRVLLRLKEFTRTKGG